MNVIEFAATARTDTGKGPVGRLRTKGLAPAIIYGSGLEPENVMVNIHEFEKMITFSGSSNPVLNLSIEGKLQSTMVRDLQRHPVSGKVIHVDFMRIRLDVEMEFDVPIEPVGQAIGVKEGGILEHVVQTVRVRCLPTIVPTELTVDVSGLDIRHSLRVKDIEAIEGVTIINDAEDSLFTILAPRIEEEPEVEDEEGIEGEGEEGEEPEVIGEKKDDAEK